MKMKLSCNGHLLLKHTLTFTGEKEIAQNGQDSNTPLRLNGEESAQRRFYFKAIADVKTHQEIFDEYKQTWIKEHPKGEKEEQQLYDAKVNTEVLESKELKKITDDAMSTQIEVELTEKTINVIKKYYKEFGNNAGWTVKDDEVIEEIDNVLAL